VNSELPDTNNRYTLCHTNTTFQSQVKTYHCQRQCIEACIGHLTMQSAEKKFTFISQLSGSCGSHSTFVFCTALVTGRLSLSDILEHMVCEVATESELTQIRGGSRGDSLGSYEPPFLLIHSTYWFFVTPSSVRHSALACQSNLATV